MEVYRPMCLNFGIHPAHLHWNMDHTLAFNCEGYSPEQADVGLMITAAEAAFQRLTAHGDLMPLGTHLEVGPAAMSALQRSVRPSMDELIGGEVKIDMPVKVTDDLPVHGWRVVMSQGVIRDVVVGND